MRTNVSWKIGGEQGQGIDSTGSIVATACNRLGYYVFAYKLFSSRIKGGHSNYKVRIGTEPIASTCSDLDVLVAIDQQTIDRNHQELHGGSLVIADSHFKPKLPAPCPAKLLAVPMSDIAKEVGNPLVRNMVALGASCRALGLPLETFRDVVGRQFARKGGEVQQQNFAALERGYRFAEEQLADASLALAPGDGKARLVMSGNEAVGLGALAAGCRVVAAYPITPASDIMEWLVSRLPRYGGVVVQAEDEIAAITMVLGAGFAGARALTATSGPGISLMQEAIGLGYMAEIPAVIVDCQRAGPSTGMPTKQEQSDLWAILFGGHGDTQRIALVPGSPEEAFYDAAQAFNLAERFQCPVFLVLDLSLALNQQTVPDLDPSRITLDRGVLAGGDDLARADENGFRRYRVTESGISPRPLPGQPKGQYLATGVEHNEYGKVTEDPANRVRMMLKRQRKVADIGMPGIAYEGPAAPEVLLVGLGSNAGPLAEARRELAQRGEKAGLARIRVLSPFPTAELARHAQGARRIVVVENNLSGQLATLVEQRLGSYLREQGRALPELRSVRKFDGIPFVPQEIVQGAQEAVEYAHAG